MARKSKNSAGRKMNATYFIFCEGKTEAAYIDIIRRHFRIPIEIITRVSDSNISQPYIDRCKRDRFSTKDDKTFLMFDLDVDGLLSRLKKIKDATLLLSNPCIELWFLLHYEDYNREISSAECLSKIKKLDSTYAKGRCSAALQKQLIEQITIATSRAKNKPAYTNPSSTIHLLIDLILKSK